MLELDLPERYRQTLLELLQACLPDAEVWAYGSRINGKSHATSDLDLVLRNPENLEKSFFLDSFKLKSAIQESTLPILVDVLDWARIPDTFKEEIQRAHVVFYRPEHSGNDACGDVTSVGASACGARCQLDPGKKPCRDDGRQSQRLGPQAEPPTQRAWVNPL
jgi:predicted nucleotidyltransferase